MTEKVTVGECLEMVAADGRVRRLTFGIHGTPGITASGLVCWYMTWKGKEYGGPNGGCPVGFMGEKKIPSHVDTAAADFKSVYRELCAEDDQAKRVGYSMTEQTKPEGKQTT